MAFVWRLVWPTVAYLVLLAAWATWRRRPAFAVRHAVAAALMWGLVGLFLWARPGFEGVHWWNRAFADASLVLFGATLAIGPTARLWRPASAALPWRRELGIWGAIAAVVHVCIYWDLVFQWDWRPFFYGVTLHQSDAGRQAVVNQELSRKSVEIANDIGLVALAYVVVLALTSNDLAQRVLGRGWSWLMQRSTTMWVLALLHTWVFAYLAYRGTRVVEWVLWVPFGVVLALQTAAYVRTVWRAARGGANGDAATASGDPATASDAIRDGPGAATSRLSPEAPRP